MRLLTRTLALLAACSMIFVGCDSLNLTPKDELASDQVWDDPSLIQSYMNDIYGNIGFGFGSPTTSGATDEAVFTHGWGAPPIAKSTITPTDRGFWDAATGRDTFRRFDWAQVYSFVRDINTFLRNVEGNETLSQAERRTLLGEAYYLRAYFYHNLMRVYGGIPYITGTFELTGDLEQYRVPRNTFEETVNNIVADLDSAQARLTAEPRRKGAATKGAAMALKSRVLLHAASDLFHESPFSEEAAQFVSYTGGSQQDRWQKALDAAQEVIDMGQYSLEPVNSAHDYHELFTKGSPSGVIWARYFDASTGSNYNGQHNISQWSSPNGYNSWSGDTPTQQHVNAYEMADGSDFQWEGGDPTSADEPVDAENPYKNRDPRFYANIMYNGGDWRPRPPGLQERDPKGVIQTGWYEDPELGGSAGDDQISGDLRPGMDTRESGIQNWNGTKTGYNVAKFVDRDIIPGQEKAHNPWQFIRYAEILLNKAEAAANMAVQGNEPMSTALQAVNKVRSRVGMPPLRQSGTGPNVVANAQELLEEIRQEREVELAFEEHRFFDIRRWKIAPEIMGKNGKGIRIEGMLDSNGELLVDHRYDYRYRVINVEQRRWEDRVYFAPISKDEMNRNSELAQNPGY